MSVRYELLDKEGKVLPNHKLESRICFSILRQCFKNDSLKDLYSINLYLNKPGQQETISDELLGKSLEVLKKIDIYKDRLSLSESTNKQYRVISYILPDEAKKNYNNFLVCMIYLRYFCEQTSPSFDKILLFYDIVTYLVSRLRKVNVDYLLLRVEPIYVATTNFNSNHSLLYGAALDEKVTLSQVLAIESRNNNESGYNLLGITNTYKTKPIDFVWDRNNPDESFKKYKKLYGIK